MRHNACNYQVKIVISWIKLFKLHSEVKTLCSNHHLFPLSFLIAVPCLSGQEFLRNPELSPGGSHMHHASHNYLANTEKKPHIMSFHISHSCYTIHPSQTPKIHIQPLHHRAYY